MRTLIVTYEQLSQDTNLRLAQNISKKACLYIQNSAISKQFLFAIKLLPKYTALRH